MLEERFSKNFTLLFDSQRGVTPVATVDGRKVLINSVDLQWHTDDDRYQGYKNYVKISFYYEDDLKKASNGDESFLDENGNPRLNNVTIRECLFDPETNEWSYPTNEI